jgi:PII-like signaling protein
MNDLDIQRELLRIKRHAKNGDEAASKYAKLLETCIQVLDDANGVTLARGIQGEHDDTYGEAIDSALALIIPVVVDITGSADVVQWYLPGEVKS